MANVPCPPYYASPTYTFTPYYKTGSFVRHYNDWYRCIVGPYCNAPSFLGYSPPGEGEKWTEAWSFVDHKLRFDCNPELQSDDSQGTAQSSSGGLILTKKPTNAPTTLAESPSVISGVVWYDANGDGRRNDPNSALTKEDFDASEKEMGAGIGNLKVLLKRCGKDSNDELLGVAYTFPFGMGVELGKASVFGADYLQGIQDYSMKGNGGDGGDISAGRIGYYSFRVLPNQIPGEFYVVFQAPVGYRLIGGSGTYWEVPEEALKDRVFPMVQAKTGLRFIQGNDDDGAGGDMLSNSTEMRTNETFSINETSDNVTIYPNDYETLPSNKPSLYRYEIPDINDFIDAFDTSKTESSAVGPITHSGYFSRSRCISIKSNPMGIKQIDAGMAIYAWPIIPFQYASFVLTVQFYDQSTNAKRRKLQAGVSLECRNYLKLKSEGIVVEDIWGCETPTEGAPQYDFVELSMKQGSEVVKIMKDFLSMRSGDFALKNIGLTYQQIKLLEEKKNRALLRDELPLDADQLAKTASQLLLRKENGNNRKLKSASIAEVARLELGFRIVGESGSTSSQDLTNILLEAIEDDPYTLLTSFKSSSSLPDYIEIAGSLHARKELEVPLENKMIDENTSAVNELSDSVGMSSGVIVGTVMGVLVFVGVLLLIVFYYCKVKNEDSDSSSSDSSSDSSNDSSKVPSNRRSKFVEKQLANVKDEEYSYESDSLSSRWYSDYEGSDTDEFDVKEAFYSGRIKPVRPARDGRSSRKSIASSGSRGSSRVGSGVSRIRSAVSESTRSSASSVRSGNSRSSSRVGSAASQVRSATNRSARSSYNSRASQSTRSSYTGRDSQSTTSSISRPTASRSTNSKLGYTSSKNSQTSSRSSSQISRMSISSRCTGGRSSQDSRKSMLSNSIGMTQGSGGASKHEDP
ncbi:hypothetical protein ACHAW6_003247 [Cyclotella cf. meneghiniana]